jgi:NodT family efflux transporter outer membrane factor (OMF) lipoprotein
MKNLPLRREVFTSRLIYDRFRITLPGLLLCLTACTTLGPDFETPEADVKAQWLATDDPVFQSGKAVNSEWWTLFNDLVLDGLIQQAYEQNLPLQVAGLRIMEARAQLGIAIGNQYPQLQEAAGALTRVNLSENEPNFDGAADEKYWTANAGFNASWELDFWGRYRRGVESASANMGSQIAAYDNALVSLTGEVASVYIRIRTLEERLVVARSNVDAQQKGYRLADVKFRAGDTSALDPAQALTLLRNTQAQIPSLESQVRQSRNALSILLGMPPGNLDALLGKGNIPVAPADVALGVPAELLRRRPDIRQAELQVAAQSAQIGIAQANLYPSFSLLGSVGFTSSDTNPSDMSDIRNSDSFGYSFGPAFSWPILNYGRLKNNVRVQDARLEESIVNYQNTVLEAAREVEDGLAGFLGAKASTGYLNDSVKSAQRAVDLSLIQYREGATGYQRVLDSQQSLLTQQDQYTASKGDIVSSLVTTYKALGGGWQIRSGKDFVPEVRQQRMQERTDWGGLVPAETLPADLPEAPPTGNAQPLFNKPDW